VVSGVNYRWLRVISKGKSSDPETEKDAGRYGFRCTDLRYESMSLKAGIKKLNAVLSTVTGIVVLKRDSGR
jgi:hypothetical protein